MLFDVNGADVLVGELHDRVQAPYVSANKSTLGGDERVSVLVRVSLDPRETWSNDIFHNSRWFTLAIERDGTIERISDSGLKGKAGMMERVALGKRWRRVKAKSLGDIVDKINRYIGEVA